MKLSVILVVVVCLAVGLLGISSASAQGGVTWTSGVQVQNLESVDANVTLTFYGQDGSVAASADYPVAANSSRTFYPLSDVTAGFNGSLVIASDREVRAITNLVGSGNGDYTASYNGFQAGSAKVSLPLIMCNNSGFNTFFNIQNAGTDSGPTPPPANITITYVPGSNGTAGLTETASIPQGASKTFDQKEGSSTRNCSTLKDASGKFIGSAIITSDQPIVAVVNQLNTTTFRVLMNYGGFATGSPSVALPLIMANNNGLYTGIQIQNTGDTATTVTVDYSANTVGTSNPVDEVFDLGPGAAKTIIQNGAPPSNGSVNNWGTVGRYIGGALVTNTGNQPLVAIVNQVRPSPALGSSYEGFNPSAATTRASAPLIMANNSSYYTGIQVQNVSPSGSADVTITYGPNTAGTFAPAPEVFTLAAGASKTIIQNSAPPGNGSTVNNWGTHRYIGSATITATGGNIVAIVNQVSFSRPGDQFSTGVAFNY